MAFLLLSSGFFLGWSLGANDGGNIFGTAVTTRMLRFNFAAVIASIFVILGAVFQGTGATQTISSLGAINEISGSFTVAIAAALSLFLMLKIKIPVSSSQAVVGAILGWNLFSSYFTDSNTLIKIVSTWFVTPVLSAGLSILFFYFFKMFFKKKIYIFTLFRLLYSNRIYYFNSFFCL
jgi:PiT family inorganic phosphate transporter